MTRSDGPTPLKHRPILSNFGAPAAPANDGRQTPMRGHPVFIAQHATACCCRGCLEKWHRIPRGRALDAAEQARIGDLLMAWIDRQMGFDPASPHPPR
ncbi:DUF4186 family protein [Paracoccus thiocyanatus]|uniref:DUF4186 family protein n=1 Tax=Paracoccus thiocyanatus TaxID=34006 RepID=UPI00122C2ED8|nr:DUF4186 family protein [Paracoccus thiocyanatus]